MLLDIAGLVLIASLCWQGYRHQRLWLVLPVYLWLKVAKGHGFWVHFLLFAPATVSGLLLCHWINTHGWHATAAGGMVLGMTIALQAMRISEEQQKEKRSPYDAV